MGSPREGSPGRRTLKAALRKALWAGLSVGSLLPAVGCQVEYAGMTLPSGKYMYDDVQYFPPGTDFPFAETQAATQRARMQAMGIDPGVAPVGPAVPPPPPPGALAPGQNIPNMPTDTNQGGVPPGPVPIAPGGNADGAGRNVPAPGGGVPAPNGGDPGANAGPGGGVEAMPRF